MEVRVRHFFFGLVAGAAFATLVYWSATDKIVAAIRAACF
jgi:hypothetical protein